MRVVSLPSEKVPAPPSPKTPFDSGLNTSLFQNPLRSLTRCGTFRPCSITIGSYVGVREPECTKMLLGGEYQSVPGTSICNKETRRTTANDDRSLNSLYDNFR